MSGLRQRLDALLPEVTAALVDGWRFPGGGEPDECHRLGGQRAVQAVLHNIIAVLFPGCHGEKGVLGGDCDCRPAVRALLEETMQRLAVLARQAFSYEQRTRDGGSAAADDAVLDQRGEALAEAFLVGLPDIQRLLQSDILAAYEGDPAAKSTMEVVLSYPGLYAIAVHRVAHFLFQQRVPLIPRIMSEWAHSQTGIDIHPGAAIGPAFFIDHGTGVVVGETCRIGAHVKLYQGVTLGAHSFEKDAQGRLVKGIKRHPDVGDHVIIYAGATILGGDTVIGDHCVIGGNVWLTHSVPSHSKVYNQQPEPLIRGRANP